MCNEGYTGVHCEERISKLFIRNGNTNHSHSDPHESKFSYYWKTLLKLLYITY
jgi:hypothetical protein